MKSKSLSLLAALAVLVSVRYAVDHWVQPVLANSLPNEVTGTAFNGLHMLLGVGTLAVVILLARSVADALAQRGRTTSGGLR